MAVALLEKTPAHITLTGQPLASAAWLDNHYESCRPEYEDTVRSVGFQPGWHILDAGCGGGSYLALLAERVGPAGRLTALDLAPDNIAAVQSRASAEAWRCPVVTARVGTLAASLPYPDDAFDAVWCANVLQYLTDEELTRALTEFRRVVRPGGRVAVKDDELGLWLVSPAAPAVYGRLFEALTRTDDALGVQMRGAYRGRALRHWLERAGLLRVWQQTTLIERWAPLRSVEKAYMGGYLAFLAAQAETVDLSEADRAYWRALADPEAPGHPIHHPEFYWCEANPVAVGQVPAGRFDLR